MRPHVVGIAGHARTGKSRVARYLGDKYGAPVYSNSRPIAQIASRIGPSLGRETYATIATAILDVFGHDLIARHWLRTIQQQQGCNLFIVEGIRYPEEVALYREAARLFLIGIESEDEIRYVRSKSAEDSEKDTNLSFEEFVALKSSKNEMHIDAIVCRADAVVTNNSSIASFFALVDDIVQDGKLASAEE